MLNLKKYVTFIMLKRLPRLVKVEEMYFLNL